MASRFVSHMSGGEMTYTRYNGFNDVEVGW